MTGLNKTSPADADAPGAHAVSGAADALAPLAHAPPTYRCSNDD